MSSLRQDEPAQTEHRQMVAVQAAIGGSPMTAHAVPAAMAKLGAQGIAHCGFPVEYLTVVPDLEWEAVATEHQCPHCAAENDAVNPGLRPSPRQSR